MSETSLVKDLRNQIEKLDERIHDGEDRLKQAEQIYAQKKFQHESGNLSRVDLQSLEKRLNEFRAHIDSLKDGRAMLASELERILRSPRAETVAQPNIPDEAEHQRAVEALRDDFSKSTLLDQIRNSHYMAGTIGFVFLCTGLLLYLVQHVEDLSQKKLGWIFLACSLAAIGIHYMLIRPLAAQRRDDTAPPSATIPAFTAMFFLPLALFLLVFNSNEMMQGMNETQSAPMEQSEESLGEEEFAEEEFAEEEFAEEEFAEEESAPLDLLSQGAGAAAGGADAVTKALKNSFYLAAFIFAAVGIVTKFSRWFLVAPFAFMIGTLFDLEGDVIKVFSNEEGSWKYAILYLGLAAIITAFAFLYEHLPPVITRQAVSNLMLSTPFAIFLGVAALPISSLGKFSLASLVIYSLVLLWAALIAQVAPRLGTLIFLLFAALQFSSLFIEKESMLFTITFMLLGLAAVGWNIFKSNKTISQDS